MRLTTGAWNFCCVALGTPRGHAYRAAQGRQVCHAGVVMVSTGHGMPQVSYIAKQKYSSL